MFIPEEIRAPEYTTLSLFAILTTLSQFSACKTPQRAELDYVNIKMKAAYSSETLVDNSKMQHTGRTT
jgi:hypothetical protein